MKQLPLLEKIVLVLLLGIFGGIVLQAPLSVALGNVWPSYALLIKSWAEIFMLVAGLLIVAILIRRRKLGLLKDPLLLLVAAYGALHLLLLPVAWQGVLASLAGLLIDLRYVLFFGLAYVFLQLHPEYKKQFLLTFMLGGLVVVGFAVLQVFVLPPDILTYLGYSKATIAPYLTVDQNQSYIRINSTLRGPNPLGAYALIVIAFIASSFVKRRIPARLWPRLLASLLAVGGVVALWASYSRSALLGTLIALVVIGAAVLFRRISRLVWIIASVITLGLIGGLVASWQTPFVSQVVLHEDPTRANFVSSNDGHVASLRNGFNRMIHEPLGGGIGSTGSASLYGDQGMIIENHYLFVAHETGWLGLALFLTLFGMIMWRLWQGRKSSLLLAVCASGLGLAVIGLLLPVWADDTVSIIWWGLAAVALATWPTSGYNKRSETVDSTTA